MKRKRVKTLYPGDWATLLLEHRGDPVKQREIMATVPESDKAPTRSVYRKLIAEIK